MRRVLAALPSPPNGGLIVPWAEAIASLSDAIVMPVPVAAILDEARDPSAVAAVIGTSADIARDVLTSIDKPVVLLGTAVSDAPARRLRRILVPLDGTAGASAAIRDDLTSLIGPDLDLEVLHVFTEATAPRTLDRPARDLACLGDEFAARYLPLARHVELTTGSVARAVARLCGDRDIDLVLVSWHQDVAQGHGAVLQDVLDTSPVPVVVIPDPIGRAT